MNCRHYDFQSYALPTELPRHVRKRTLRRGQKSYRVGDSDRKAREDQSSPRLDGTSPRTAQALSKLRPGHALQGLGASCRELSSVWPRLRTKPGRHVGVHDRRRSFAGRRDHRAGIFRLRPLTCRMGAGSVCRRCCVARVDIAEPVGRRHRAALPVAHLLAGSRGPGPRAAWVERDASLATFIRKALA